MHGKLGFLFFVLLLAGVAVAQQKPASHPAKANSASMSTAPSATKLPSEETVNSFLQQMFGYDPSITWKVSDIRPSQAEGLAEITVVLSNPQGSQTNKLYVTPDGRHALTGDMIPFGARPFEPARRELEKDVTGPSHGPANAPVLLVEFSDFQCPHCKAAQPTLDKLMSEQTNVRVVMQNFPLPSHDWAAKAAAYADCVGRSSNDVFWKFTDSVYNAQAEITAANADQKLTALSESAGVNGSEIAACAAKPETTTRVERSVALGKSLDVNSTPTIFINGRKMSAGGLPYETLKGLVDFAAKQPK